MFIFRIMMLWYDSMLKLADATAFEHILFVKVQADAQIGISTYGYKMTYTLKRNVQVSIKHSKV